MDRSDPYFYPATPETIHSYAASIFAPIKRDECTTTVWVPMAGRRKWNKFIIENIDLFEKELPNYDKYIMVYVEPLDLTEETLVGYLQLMGRSFVSSLEKNSLGSKISLDQKFINLLNDPTASYHQLLELLRESLLLVTREGLEIVFFLGEFDELRFSNKVLCNNLKSLWARLYPRMHYIFMMVKVPNDQDNIYLWDELSELVLQNIFYMPLRSGMDLEYLIDSFANDYKYSIPEDIKETIKKICGGHPYSLRVATRVFRDNNSLTASDFQTLLRDHYELKSIATGIFDRRSNHEKELLKQIVAHKSIEKNLYDNLSYLEHLGLITKDKEGYHLYSQLFEDAVNRALVNSLESNVQSDLGLDPASGAIVLNGVTVEESFTRQEYSILTLFLKNPGKLLTRDDVGGELWGDSSYEKYSDWAIDQLMSKLRKKLRNIGVDAEILTLRGRGYKFSLVSSQ